MIVFNEDESADHTVRIEVAEEDRDKKFTILGFGYVLYGGVKWLQLRIRF